MKKIIYKILMYKYACIIYLGVKRVYINNIYIYITNRNIILYFIYTKKKLHVCEKKSRPFYKIRIRI